jgi:hypothetical protein
MGGAAGRRQPAWQLNFALAAFLLGRALHVEATLLDMIVIMPTVTVATTLPVSRGGWGVREGVLMPPKRCRCRCCSGYLV